MCAWHVWKGFRTAHETNIIQYIEDAGHGVRGLVCAREMCASSLHLAGGGALDLLLGLIVVASPAAPAVPIAVGVRIGACEVVVCMPAHILRILNLVQ